MCGIWSLIDLTNKPLDKKFLSDFWNIQKRGPDGSTFRSFPRASVGFHRLAIMDDNFRSNQPYVLEEVDKTVVFICNGEIYNYKNLIQKYELDITSNSDCLTIPKLYLKFYHEKEKFFELFEKEIKAEFAFVLLEFDHLKSLRNVLIGRDAVGVRPLYYSKPDKEEKKIIISSEVKGTLNFKKEYDSHIVKEFPPGNILELNLDELSGIKLTYHNYIKWLYNIEEEYSSRCNGLQSNLSLGLTEEKITNLFLQKVRDSTINSVRRRLDADRPIAFLLSGGIDSSLVCAISQKILGQPIKTFCCGMEGASDLKYAREVADHIGSFHTEIIFTEREALSAIEDVIYTIESWDTTTIRASVGQYLVSKYISENTDCKVVLVGEGPDEVCSSYLFNWYAPDDEKSISESSKEYVKNIHLYDCKRSDRCISNWGLEGRVPFLDAEFIENYWKIPSRYRHPKFKGYEKWWLREPFKGLLPESVLWRKKEAFSDGISSTEKSWFKIIQDFCESKYSDEDLLEYSRKIGVDIPTKEALHYMKIFIEKFGESNINIIRKRWQPKWDENGLVRDYVDPSARTLKVY